MGDYVMKNNNIFKHKLILIFNGILSVIGAIILVACIIVFLIIYFANLKQKSISIQKSILETVQNDNTNDSIENKLLKLEKLKEMNLITTAEYETKRQNIIDNI